jgi:hypothetical protein
LDMVADLRLKLRNAGICLLTIAASIPLCASVSASFAASPFPQIPTTARRAPQPYDSAIALSLPASQFHASTRTCLPLEFGTLSSAIARRSARRTFIFVEDTTPPSSKALQTVQLQIPPRPQAPPPPVSQSRRSPFISVSNRQRAP